MVYRAKSAEKTYAVKRPRLTFECGQNESDTMQQLYSLHLELRVLADKYIRAHENIAKLATIIWEEHPDDLGRYWPSLVMEYADRGTLAEVYKLGLSLSLESEKALCHNIGDALSFLHDNGVIHGDIKPGNILMYSGPTDNSVIPKLSDFGFSVLDQNVVTRLPGGTRNWEAPEMLEKHSSDQDLMLPDTYSFGLLVWYIARNGMAPFANLEGVGQETQSVQTQECIRDLKKTVHVPTIASSSIDSRREVYHDVFALTLDREPQKRALKSALARLHNGKQAERPKPPNIVHLSHRMYNDKVGDEIRLRTSTGQTAR